MKDIYSKEERNKILNMAMKQYECCGVSLELGDYFVVEEYPTMIFKIDNEKFWYVTKKGNIFSRSYDLGDPNDTALFLIGNCFKNNKEAEENKEKMLLILNRDKPFIDLNPLNKE